MGQNILMQWPQPCRAGTPGLSQVDAALLPSQAAFGARVGADVQLPFAGAARLGSSGRCAFRCKALVLRSDQPIEDPLRCPGRGPFCLRACFGGTFGRAWRLSSRDLASKGVAAWVDTVGHGTPANFTASRRRFLPPPARMIITDSHNQKLISGKCVGVKLHKTV